MTQSAWRKQRAIDRAAGKLEVLDGGKNGPARPKPPMLVSLTILTEKEVGVATDGLYEFMKKHYVTRNDFLNDVFKEGLRSCFAAQKAAAAELQRREIEAAAEKDQANNMVQLVPRMPAELPTGMAEASARLDALKRGE